MSHTDTFEQDIQQAISTYLEGLHNPREDSLYNDLRAKRDTEALKEACANAHNKAITALLTELMERKKPYIDAAIGGSLHYSEAISSSVLQEYIERYGK